MTLGNHWEQEVTCTVLTWMLLLKAGKKRILENGGCKMLMFFTLVLPDSDEAAAGVWETRRGAWARSVTHRAEDEDRSSCVRGWRQWGVPRPPRPGRQDEEAAVAQQAQSLRGRPHGARCVADGIPVAGHRRTLPGELEQRM